MSSIDFLKKVIFANLVIYEVLHGQRRYTLNSNWSVIRKNCITIQHFKIPYNAFVVCYEIVTSNVIKISANVTQRSNITSKLICHIGEMHY